ncbi:MAG: short-chain fatty acyl-CoA regulator family protein, partial [Pseudomonadota bacterium]
KLATIYKVDAASFHREGGEETKTKLEDILRDPLFKDLDLPMGEVGDLVMATPNMAEAFLRLYTAHREGQIALADQQTTSPTRTDPIEETRRFLLRHHNYFPVLDAKAERIAAKAQGLEGLTLHLKEKHGLTVKRRPPDLMNGMVRWFEPHRRELSLSDTLDRASTVFQAALQIAYLELTGEIEAALSETTFQDNSSYLMAKRALANYAAGAILLPYTSFFKEAEARKYDVEALGRRFGASFEQTAHRLTTLQKPGSEGVPFFFIRVDPAGNVSKRLDGGGFPFARHGGSCPLWSLHHSFRRPREIVTEFLELPEGERFFSISRTVTSGGGEYDRPQITRAVALGCRIDQAHRLVYAQNIDFDVYPPTPIGVTCRLCQRGDCAARAEPPLGRALLPDDYRRMNAPFGFADI